jgi:23S rRNA (adenine2503-C2)-methyltransferase
MMPETAPASAKAGLAGLLPGRIAELLGLLPFRGEQIFKWINRLETGFSGMTDLPLSLRRELEEKYRIRTGTVTERLEDPDGTVKLRLDFGENTAVETVLLSDRGERRTACLSTQAGCPMGCAFCRTGTLGLRRSLSAGEIAEQYLFLKDLGADISTVVVMGMGEPLLNMEALRGACAFLCHEKGAALSPKRVTVSTCGIAEGIRELADRGPPVRLALSLTTADEKLREALMPGSDPLPRIREALVCFQAKGGGRVTLETVLLGGLNTRRKDAAGLASFAEGLDTVVNLIPWNPVEGLGLGGRPFREPSTGEIAEFAGRLKSLGLRVTRRYRRGRGIGGACGQLGGQAAP